MNPQAQSPEFYVWQEGYEYAESNRTYYPYAIVRNGSMKMFAQNGDIIRYTDELIKMGITTDTQLEKAFEDDTLEIGDNPWFEVWNLEDPTEESDVYYTLEEAQQVAHALRLTLDTDERISL